MRGLMTLSLLHVLKPTNDSQTFVRFNFLTFVSDFLQINLRELGFRVVMHGTSTHNNMILMHGTNTHTAFRV